MKRYDMVSIATTVHTVLSSLFLPLLNEKKTIIQTKSQKKDFFLYNFSFEIEDQWYEGSLILLSLSRERWDVRQTNLYKRTR